MSSRKTALVTGSAARIGAAICATLHARGCDVVLHYNASSESAEGLAGRLNRERPGSVFPVQADLSSPAGVDTLAGRVSERFDRLDVLVNNASRFYPTNIGQTQAWQWDDLLNSNLRGPYFLVQALLGPLRTAGGSVVNILDVHADEFWQSFGLQGDGILVANIDTGVQWDHPALDQAFKCGSDPTDRGGSAVRRRHRRRRSAS